jgi:drug/metabolite transporter (DMT)-like permease
MVLTTGLQGKTYALLVPIVLFASIGNVLLGKGMRQVGEVRSWSPTALAGIFLRASANGWIWLGIGSLLLFLFSLMVVLSWADYSFVMPASSASYAAAALLSHWLLKEVVTPERWAGVALICLGVALITRTPSRSRAIET